MTGTSSFGLLPPHVCTRESRPALRTAREGRCPGGAPGQPACPPWRRGGRRGAPGWGQGRGVAHPGRLSGNGEGKPTPRFVLLMSVGGRQCNLGPPLRFLCPFLEISLYHSHTRYASFEQEVGNVLRGTGLRSAAAACNGRGGRRSEWDAGGSSLPRPWLGPDRIRTSSSSSGSRAATSGSALPCSWSMSAQHAPRCPRAGGGGATWTTENATQKKNENKRKYMQKKLKPRKIVCKILWEELRRDAAGEDLEKFSALPGGNHFA